MLSLTQYRTSEIQTELSGGQLFKAGFFMFFGWFTGALLLAILFMLAALFFGFTFRGMLV